MGSNFFFINVMVSLFRLQDTLMVIERYKSGFVTPEDIPFEDLSRESDTNTMNSTASKNAVPNSHTNHTGIRPDRTIKGTMSVKNKKRSALLGIFSSNKVSVKSSTY